MLESLALGFSTALTVANLGYAAAGVLFGTLVGVLPRQSPAWGTIRSKWELLHVLCPYSKEINANRTLLKRRKKASYRANFLLIVPMLYRFKKYF